MKVLLDVIADVREAIELNPRWRTLIARIPESVFPGVETVCRGLSIERTR